MCYSEIYLGLIQKVLQNKYINLFSDKTEQTKLIELNTLEQE